MVGALGLPQKTMAQQSTLPILDTLAYTMITKSPFVVQHIVAHQGSHPRLPQRLSMGYETSCSLFFFSHIAKFKLEKPGYYAVFFWMLLGSSQSTHPSQEVDGGYDLKMGLVRATITMLVKRALVTSAPSQKW
jgi:hypothetical protein